jgi:iron only hydrogenase large subunit-like protein
MERRNPIYTQKRECQDCHKCIRECPVKAIRVEDGYARVVPELCIMCGNCVLACPSSAKRVRDDLPSARLLLKSGRKVIASLAPSFVAQFSGVSPAQLIHALKKLGFYAASETALGAQQVSASISALMRSEPKQIWISSACPVVVDFIGKYHPECQPHLFGVLSPLLTHCKMLRAHYGDDIAIVFIGPCIAKKTGGRTASRASRCVLTFEDLDHWLDEEGIHLDEIAGTPEDRFQPDEAEEGALYPIDGGMIPGAAGNRELTARSSCLSPDSANVEQALKGILSGSPSTTSSLN